jgi:NAD(P)-dependent dehydrogenase (short-subunit alcohol dehydrogenase family)
MSQKLEGKIALITGGNSGIGLATAQRFAEEGAYVFITGRRQAELDEAVKLIGPNAFGVQGDVSKLADLDRLYATIKQKKGRIDVLFANAGSGEFARLGEITEAHYDKWFGTNVKGMLFTVQKALPLYPTSPRHSDRLDRRHQGVRELQRVQRHQGGRSLVREDLDLGPQGTQDPRQRAEPRADRNARDRAAHGQQGRNRPVGGEHVCRGAARTRRRGR